MRNIVVRCGASIVVLAVAVSVSVAPIWAQGKKSSMPSKAMVERGKYLVTVGGCDDCHSPKVMTAQGPVPDTTRLLSGHRADQTLPEVPAGLIGPNGWGAVTNNEFTAWAGPWGTSFAQNLTPDTATGLGSWTVDMFTKAIRTGKHMGEGRDILPPMPWPAFAHMTDDDLRAIFSYLKSLPAIENSVPEPIAPTGERVPTPMRSNH
jgi:hypothetical protein